jgi:ABC-2 type transport system permease protein
MKIMRFNAVGFLTLLRKEVWRFLKVGVQTVLAPVVTTLLYLLVFGHVLEDALPLQEGLRYGQFLLPGLILMALAQNAFANSSSSLIQSKMNGNIVFVLLAPISAFEFYLAFTLAAVLRGLAVGAALWLVAWPLIDVPLVHPLEALGFAAVASAVLGSLGILAGVYSDKYDHLAAFQNFLIVPLTFLSGVFYSIESLSPFWQAVSFWNPMFYLIDGFRHALLGIADVNPLHAWGVALLSWAVLAALCLRMLRSGYKLRN